MLIANGDIENSSMLAIAVATSIADDWSSVYNKYQIAAVVLYSDKIKIKNDYTLRINKKSNNYITYSVTPDDIVEEND